MAPSSVRPGPWSLAAVALMFSLGGCSRARGGDAARGEALFRERCGLCHATGDEPGQGPGLGGVVGRKAAGGARFGYSKPLAEAGLVWDAATLDRFLAAPTALVAGTSMLVATPAGPERRDIIAYLATLRGAGAPAARGPAAALEGPPPAASAGRRAGAAALGGYLDDGPGVERRITVADLPPPFATKSARNGPSVVEPRPGTRPYAPPGFVVALFAEGLRNPRLLRVAPNGDIFVAETGAGQIRVLRAADGASSPSQVEVFTREVDRPFGIAFYPPGPDPRWVYVANNNSVVRFAYERGDLGARGGPQTVVARLSESTGGHSTRDLVFSPDGRRMFVSVGSASNVAESMKPLAAEQQRAWDEARVPGAAWGEEEGRAQVVSFDPEGKGVRVFAAGLRNCVGLAVQPATGALWCSTNERDGLGDDLVPDYITRVREGAFYGWPWFYLGDNEDPRQKGARPDLVGKVSRPDVLLQAHSASLQMTFHDHPAFPPAMRGSAFAALHGSWNRSIRTGPKVIRVLLDAAGAPTGAYEDFLTGFAIDNERVWGRPVGVAVARDGALLVSEDGRGTIWRVSYQPSR